MTMKKIYIIFTTLMVIGIAAGVYYFGEYRQSQMYIPSDITMKTAWNEEYAFKDMPKKVRLIEFIYTNCPDVCPTTTHQMVALRKKLEAQKVFGSKVEFLTVTIDPKRDTFDKLQTYAKQFNIEKNSPWVIVRGSMKDTKKLADQFRFLFRDPGSGNIIHTTQTYLVDEDNELIKIYGMGEDNFKTNDVYDKIMSKVD